MCPQVNRPTVGSTWVAADGVEALVPGRVRSYGTIEEILFWLRERAARMVLSYVSGVSLRVLLPPDAPPGGIDNCRGRKLRR